MNQIMLPPSLPESWIEQIRKAILSSTWITLVTSLLGSSVIAALIGFGSSYVSEIHTANVELAKKQTIEKREALQGLSNHLLALNRELDNLIATGQLLPRYGSNSQLLSFARKSVDHCGEQMELIFGDLKDTHIGEDIQKDVNEILDAVGPRLQQVQKNPKKISELAESYVKELQEKIRRAEVKIDQTIRRTEL